MNENIKSNLIIISFFTVMIIFIVLITITVIRNKDCKDIKETNYLLQINSQNKTIMIIYPNGSIWIQKDKEKEAGKQLARVSIAYSSYLKGFCDNLK